MNFFFNDRDNEKTIIIKLKTKYADLILFAVKQTDMTTLTVKQNELIIWTVKQTDLILLTVNQTDLILLTVKQTAPCSLPQASQMARTRVPGERTLLASREGTL